MRGHEFPCPYVDFFQVFSAPAGTAKVLIAVTFFLFENLVSVLGGGFAAYLFAIVAE